MDERIEKALAAYNAIIAEEEWDDTKIMSALVDMVAAITSGITMNRLSEICAAEREGRCVILPVKANSTVYTIQENYFDCENCQYGAEARYQKEIDCVSCDMENRHCPRRIDRHVVSGFDVCSTKDDRYTISGPGEYGYEGLETFSGIDGKWYASEEEAQAALDKEASDAKAD